MDEKPFPLPVHEVLLHFSNIMTDIINNMHVQVVWRGLEHLGKGLSCQECHAAPIDPGKVSGRCHAVQILLALLEQGKKSYFYNAEHFAILGIEY
jgi:hypothetical protein